MCRKESRINQLGRDIGGKPDVTIHKVGNHQVLTFTFEQDGHKYSIWLEYTTKVELIW